MFCVHARFHVVISDNNANGWIRVCVRYQKKTQSIDSAYASPHRNCVVKNSLICVRDSQHSHTHIGAVSAVRRVRSLLRFTEYDIIDEKKRR